MDVLRSCYQTKMRFVQGAEPVNVRWYFCPPGTKAYERPSPFRSLQWEGDWHYAQDDGGLGEVAETPRPYDKGRPPTGVMTNTPLGTEVEFENGASAGYTPLPANAEGVPLACLVNLPPPPEPIQTDCCEPPIPRELVMRITVDVGSLAIPLEFPIVYNDDAGRWESEEFTECVATNKFALVCNPIGFFGWFLLGLPGTSFNLVPDSVVCEPFHAEFSGIINQFEGPCFAFVTVSIDVE